jgi:hypothetical protein
MLVEERVTWVRAQLYEKKQEPGESRGRRLPKEVVFQAARKCALSVVKKDCKGKAAQD